MDRRALVASVLPLWLVGACTGGGSDDEPAAAPGTVTSGTSSEASADLDAILDYTKSLVPHYDLSVPGGVVLVADDEDSRSLAFGEAQLSPDRPMQTTDRFAIGSNTKTMVAVVVLQLVEEGRLSLDDTVEQWKPGLVEEGDRITVENLLSHRSGLYDPINHPGGPGWGVDLTDAHLRELLDHPLTDPPGTTSRYSNSNYWVLGKIIEAATSRPLGRELQQRVFDPAGMETAALATDLDRERRMPRGYDEDDDDVTPGDVTGAWAAGGVVATAEDVAAFYRALFSNQLISQESVDDMTTPRGGFPDGAEYGLGLIVVEPDCTQGVAVGHEGQLDGFRSLVLRDPATGVVVVTLVNAIGARADEALENLTVRTLCYA